ncbi:hypothetical protein ACHAXM_005365 [Skeletonema potamos]
MWARSRSISPSTSIRSHSADDSDSDDSGDDTSRYAGLTEDELMTIWERRNLAYFDRRQRLLAEDRKRQQQEEQDGDAAMSGEEESAAMSTEVEQQQVGMPREFSAPLSSVQREQHQQHQQQQQARPAAYRCAIDDPLWRDMTSRNIMGEVYNPHRGNSDPAYRNAWIACQRLVNMNRSGADPDGFIPTNPRLAALLEHRRREIARERYEEEAARHRQQQEIHPSFYQVGAAVEQGVDGDTSTSSSPPGDLVAAQADEYERRNQARRLQQQELQCSSNSRKSYSSGSSSGSEKSVTIAQNRSYYLALPYPTQQLIKFVVCTSCNCALYTTPVAKRFFCQTCGRVSSTPRLDDDASYEEKIQDAEDVHMSG